MVDQSTEAVSGYSIVHKKGKASFPRHASDGTVAALSGSEVLTNEKILWDISLAA
jgi:hypothetical protein